MCCLGAESRFVSYGVQDSGGVGPEVCLVEPNSRLFFKCVVNSYCQSCCDQLQSRNDSGLEKSTLQYGRNIGEESNVSDRSITDLRHNRIKEAEFHRLRCLIYARIEGFPGSRAFSCFVAIRFNVSVAILQSARPNLTFRDITDEILFSFIFHFLY